MKHFMWGTHRGSASPKHAQVTLYIIIGLLLVLGVGIIIYFLAITPPQIPGRISPEKVPVNVFVEECVRKVSTDALQQSALRGGYLDLSGFAKETAIYDPFNSEVLSLFNGGMYLPYWYYQKSDTDRVNIPQLEKVFQNDGSIQDQLEKYISQKLPDCFDNFRVFKARNISVTPLEIEGPATKVSFGDDVTSIKVTYPLQVTQPEGEESLDEFHLTLPLQYKKVYSLAKEIAEAELERVFLEDATTNFLAIYSRTNADYLPPLYGDATFGDCANRVFWVEPEVKENVRAMLASNLPYLKVANTRFDQRVVGQAEEPNRRNRAIRNGVFKGFVQEVTQKKYPDLEVMFSYDESFPLDLNFGKASGLLEPNELNLNIVFGQFCMFDYNFLYNLKYPVLVSVLDPESKTDQGELLFQYPIQVVLKNNFPRLLLRSEPLTGAGPVVTDHQCDASQRVSDEVTLNVADREGKPLHHVLVYYQCGPSSVSTFDSKTNTTTVQAFAQKCFMGTTDKGTLYTKFPQCTGGGLLSFVKNDYVEKVAFVGPISKDHGFIGAGQDIVEKDITLDKIKNVSVKVMKYFVKPPTDESTNAVSNPGIVLKDGTVVQCNLYSEPRFLQNNEQALIRLTKLDEENGILRGVTTIMYRGNETNMMPLAPGKYRADVMLLRNEQYEGEQTIKKNSEMRTVPSSIPGSEKTLYYPENDVTLPTIFTGGSLIEFEITPADMQHSTINVYVIDEGPPKRIEDIGRSLKDRQGCSELNPTLLKPNFSS